LLRGDCLEPNGENASDAELLVAMEAAPNKRSYRRLAAMRALLRGWPRAEVAQVFGRSERMVRLWILAFNSGGIDALASKPRPGRPRKVKLERVRDLLVPVLEEPGKAGQRHWTGVKLHGWLKEQLCLELAKLSSSTWGSCGRILQSNCGMATSAVWKAIRDRAGAGRHAAAARACLT
jgi:transposase